MPKYHKPYSPERKEQLTRRMVGPEAITPTELARETGIGRTTLWRWQQEAYRAAGIVEAEASSPEQRTPQEKMRLVLAAEGLSGQQLGEFLRKEGVFLADLQRWREQMLGGLNGAAARDQGLREKLRQVEQDKRQTEQELRRKEAALAETAALLVLSKKARRLWGDEDVPTVGKTEPTS